MGIRDISVWREQVVDTVISQIIVPKLQGSQPPRTSPANTWKSKLL